MKTLNLLTINRLICYTDKGMLTLQIRKGDNKYHLCLDSVPVDKELNKTLMDLLFPAPKMEISQVNKAVAQTTQKIVGAYVDKQIINTVLGKKKAGRPKKVK